MDLSDPTRAVTPTLDGPVLAALATAGRPLTVGQVAALAARGSEIGVRRSLARLVEQGTVRATVMGRNQVHELNRDHLAAQAAMLLAGLRLELWARFRSELENWDPRPLYACVFGSAARGDGDAASDIDLLLVHPPFPGERTGRLTPALREQIAVALTAADGRDAVERWQAQLDELRDAVQRWTGNPLQVVDLSFAEWRHPANHQQPMLAEARRDGVELRRARALTWWNAPEVPDA